MSYDTNIHTDMHSVGVNIGVLTDVTVLTAPAETDMIVMDALFVNFSASPVDVIVKWNDGTNDYTLINETLAAKTRVNLPLEYLMLFATHTLLVNCSVINVVDVTVCYSDIPPEGNVT